MVLCQVYLVAALVDHLHAAAAGMILIIPPCVEGEGSSCATDGLSSLGYQASITVRLIGDVLLV